VPRRYPHRIDARSTIIRRVTFAIRVHDIVYGFRARPLTRAARNAWALVLSHYTRSRELRYGEALAVAEALAAELRATGVVLQPTSETDENLRRMLSSQLARAARAAAVRGGRRPTPNETTKGRIEAVVVTEVLSGICPRCGAVLPCEVHGLGVYEPDGRGGLARVADTDSRRDSSSRSASSTARGRPACR
jgi:hypothetical protein